MIEAIVTHDDESPAALLSVYTRLTSSHTPLVSQTMISRVEREVAAEVRRRRVTHKASSGVRKEGEHENESTRLVCVPEKLILLVPDFGVSSSEHDEHCELPVCLERILSLDTTSHMI